MQKLQAGFLHGLNERTGDEYKNEESHQLSDARFLSLNLVPTVFHFFSPNDSP